jgi:OFA family oxalate/formate antiporter-like MFS transporter
MTILSTSYGLHKGFQLESAILILTAFNLTNGIGRLISGYFSDTIGPNRIMGMAFLAAGLAAVVGFSFGTLFSVSAQLVADCFGLKHFGAIFGLTFAAYGFIAGPIGPTLSGYLLDARKDNFFLVFSYLGIFYILSWICIRFVARPSSRH